MEWINLSGFYVQYFSEGVLVGMAVNYLHAKGIVVISSITFVCFESCLGSIWHYWIYRLYSCFAWICKDLACRCKDFAWHCYDMDCGFYYAHLRVFIISSPLHGSNLYSNHQGWELDRMASNDFNVGGGTVKVCSEGSGCQRVSHVVFLSLFIIFPILRLDVLL